MKKSEKQTIIKHYREKCDCSEDDNCGCSFPNNTRPQAEAEADDESAGSPSPARGTDQFSCKKR